MPDALTKNAGAGILQRLRECCNGVLPKIPNLSQSFRESTDKATWWGKGLEIDFIRVSLLKTRRPVVAMRATTASPAEPPAKEQQLTTSPSLTSSAPLAAAAATDPAAAAQQAVMALMAAMQTMSSTAGTK